MNHQTRTSPYIIESHSTWRQQPLPWRRCLAVLDPKLYLDAENRTDVHENLSHGPLVDMAHGSCSPPD